MKSPSDKPTNTKKNTGSNSKKKVIENLRKENNSAAATPPSIPKKVPYVKTSLCHLHLLIQVKVGCFVVKEDDNLFVYRALDTNGCKGIVHEDKFLSSNCCRCPSHYERLIPLAHKLLKYCSKIYKEKNLITMAFGDTQKILNIVTDDELKSYETRYRKKVNILDDSKEHKPPTLVEKQPDQFNFTLSDSGEEDHSINREQEKDLKKMSLNLR